VDKTSLKKTLVTINGTEVELNVVNTLQHIKGRAKTIREISMQLAAYRSRKYFNESLQVIGTSMVVKSALLLSKYLARQIENDFRHNQFIDFIKKALPLFLEHLPEVKGVRIQFKGRLNGSDRSKTQWFKYGQIPFHTIREKIDYGYTPAFTLYGTCGIKVWICFAPNDQDNLKENASSKTGKV
jgi:ribosomal protein S3